MGMQAVSILPTTGTVQLSDADIARMNAEAAAAASSSPSGLLSKVTAVARGTVTAIANPFTTIYSLVAPLGMLAFGFVDQAFQSIQNTDYMGSTLAVMVDPATQWSKFMTSEAATVKKLAGLSSASSTTTPAASTPTAQELDATGWAKQYKAGPVGMVYDFGFAGAGDDLTQPFGFLRSVATGKYYYRPVKAQIVPASMALEGKSYQVDFRQRPFSVLVPKLLLSLFGQDVAAPIWNKVVTFTQLDPVKIFAVKAVLLFSSAIKNSFQRVQTKTDDVGQVYTKTSWGSYLSTDKGAKYPGLMDVQTEIAKLIQRLKITPDIKRTVIANNGQTLPSKWDTSKIVYLGDVSPGLVLLSVLPSSWKALLNKLFSVNVDFYNFQSAIDCKNKLKPSDIESLYGHIRSYGSSVDAIAKMQAAASAGSYTDGYVLKLAELQNRVSSIVWVGGSQTFTDSMKLFFLLRWLLKDLYTGLEFVISRYDQPQDILATPQQSAANTASLNQAGTQLADDSLQDQSVSSDVLLADTAGRSIDLKLARTALAARVAALKQYAQFVTQYASSFISNSIGDSSIDARYVHTVPSKDLSSFSVEQGGPDDLSTYFSPSMMKKTLKDYVAAVNKEVSTTLAGIDAAAASLSALFDVSQAANAAYEKAQQSGVVSTSMITAKVNAEDDIITELRKRSDAAQDYGLYPLGYDAKYLKTVNLPGAVYLAYCLDFQAKLLSAPFEGDALYSYDDSFYDASASYLNLLAILMRANEDLSRAGAVVSAINGPVTFKDAQGRPYVVPSGSDFYLNSLKKYDQYYLLQEQNLRQAQAAGGTSSAAYKTALTNYTNAHKLLIQKRRDMNNVLRTFEFDRRKGAMYTPVSVVSSQALALIGSAQNALQGGALTSSSAVSVSSDSGSSSAVTSVAPNQAAGILGSLDDGTVVYSYERSVTAFLQAELARFAFRAKMLNLDDLKDFVFAVTGIQAEDLWAGVQAKKRSMFFAQQAAAQAAQAQAATPVPVSGGDPLAQILSDGGVDVALDGGDVVVEESASSAAGSDQSAGSAGVSGAAVPVVQDVSSSSAVQGAATATVVPTAVANTSSEPVLSSASDGSSSAQDMSNPFAVPTASAASVGGDVGSGSSGGSIASVAAMTAPVASSSQAQVAASSTQLLSALDLDNAVAAVAGQGKQSFNDTAGLSSLQDKLSDLFTQGSAAVSVQNGQLFTRYATQILVLASQALDPSDDVKRAFVTALQRATSLVALNGEASKLSDVDAVDNLLEVVTYMQGGILASHSSELSVIASQLSAWLKSH